MRGDHLRWDAFHEGGDLKSQVEAFHLRQGHHPKVVRGDPVCGTQENWRYLKGRGIRFAGKPLGRPPKVTEAKRQELKRLKAQRREEYLQRIPIEGKFGPAKNSYRLNCIRAKRADTSSAWINSIFLVMILQMLLRIISALWNRDVAVAPSWLLALVQTLFRRREIFPAADGISDQAIPAC
ncbi:MAG: transposase [Gammaproteobacteria bacterium]